MIWMEVASWLGLGLGLGLACGWALCGLRHSGLREEHEALAWKLYRLQLENSAMRADLADYEDAA